MILEPRYIIGYMILKGYTNYPFRRRVEVFSKNLPHNVTWSTSFFEREFRPVIWDTVCNRIKFDADDNERSDFILAKCHMDDLAYIRDINLYANTDYGFYAI